MKFAKELERDAVPEWRVKYLNYKVGKKYVKAVSRAVNRANGTPRGLNHRSPSYLTNRTHRTSFNPRDARQSTQTSEWSGPPAYSQGQPSSQPHPIPPRAAAEDEALTDHGSDMHYGSFVPTPPTTSPLARADAKNEFELPAPAMKGPPDSPHLSRQGHSIRRVDPRDSIERRASSHALPTSSSSNTFLTKSWSRRKDHQSKVDAPSPLRRIFSHSPGVPRDQSGYGLQPFDLVREREYEFYDFMDSELDKVDSFYRLKEEQAGKRLALLREQLHEMRNRRLGEMTSNAETAEQLPLNVDSDNAVDRGNGWVRPIKSKLFPPGPNSKALQNMPRTPYLSSSSGQTAEGRRDYVRRPEHHDVPYRTAKRKLKLALQEFYRGLELLKSYALLNRTAFRKLNKKFDKSANARPPLRYMNEKVNKAWFVNSDVLDGHIKAVEDLYARYFERGNHKLAVGKLRSLSKKATDESGSSFLNGFLIGTGIVFAIQGLVHGIQLQWSDDPTLRQQTSFLLQIYGGYFLMLLLFSLFCINCYIWTKCKVNYAFVFEFDPRSHVDWRRLAEFPSFFLLVFGVVMWANFSRYGDQDLYLYYPVILIGFTVTVILFPAPVLAYKTRNWFAYSHWRLLLAGIYPVEFRDFFMGDMYCSLTYAMANIEIFFCLYANNWESPRQCNSNNSRLLGFFTALPAIWRLLQCLRRYKDTRNVFPHLVNGGKYTMTIVSYITLSIYRITDSRSNLAIFIFFSAVNSVYCSIWDVFMDFSLLQFHSRHYFLRDILALKRRWPYYFILIVDPILRFSWIFYAIFTHGTQHSTIFSFLVSLLEIIRRGMWALFRVENEHCANVSQYKASRDVPLPYRIEPLMDRASAETSPDVPAQSQDQQQQQSVGTPHEQASAQEQGSLEPSPFPRPGPGFSTSSSTAVASTLGTLRRRADTGSARTFSKILAEAHKQDFEKKRKSKDADGEEVACAGQSDDDDDDDSEEEVLERREAARLRRTADDIAEEEGDV